MPTVCGRITWGFLIFIALSVGCLAQPTAAEPLTLRLWEGEAPGAVGVEDKDIPTLTVYLPQGQTQPTGAIVICPGGGYGGLAMDHEGHQIARWANRMGLAGVILSYRHRGRGYGHPAPCWTPSGPCE